MLVLVGVVIRAVGQAPPDIDSCKAVWTDTRLPLNDRAIALSYVLYADTSTDALTNAWALLGQGPPDPKDTVWLRAYAADAMVKARRTGNQDDHEAAAKWFAIAAGRYKAIGNRRFETEAHRWCGYALNNLGRFSEAAPHLMAAERGYKELNDSTGITDVCCSLGYAFLMQENHDLAKEQFLRGLDHARGRDPQWEFTMLYKIAESEFDGGRYDSAKVYLERARGYKRQHEVEDIDDVISTLDADFALRKNRCDEALTIYQALLRKQRSEQYSADRICYMILSVAEAHFCAARYAETYQLAKEGLGMAERVHMLEIQERALRIMSACAEKLGRPEEALRLHKQMTAVRDSLDHNESLSVLSSSLLGMRLEEQLRSDSLTAVLALNEARETARRSRTQRIALIALTTLSLLIAFLLVNRYRLKRRLHVEQLRSRLSRDLHDDIGGTLSSISILSNVVKKRAEASGDADSAASMAKISERSQRLMRDMSDIVWSVDPGKDSLTDLICRMREFGTSVLEPKGIAFHFNAPEQAVERELSAEVKKNLYLIFKEAVNNAAKHAGAKGVFVDVAMNGRSLHVQVDDDGKGLRMDAAPSTGHGGNGLRNMKARAEEIGALFNTGTSERGGARVAVELVLG